MKALLTLVFSYLLITAPAFGHGGSHKPVSPDAAVKIAGNVATQFTKVDPGLGFGTLAVSWSKLPAEQISLYKRGKGYYIVEVKNPTENKSLFVLMAISGEVYDANFTGEFNGVK